MKPPSQTAFRQVNGQASVAVDDFHEFEYVCYKPAQRKFTKRQLTKAIRRSKPIAISEQLT